jgi:Flp pilus assembly protein protease CpaA
MTGVAAAELESAGTGRRSAAASDRAPVDATAVSTLAAVAATAAWAISGRASLVPVVVVGVLALVAAVVDHRAGVIPNGLVLAGLAAVATCLAPAAMLDHRAITSVLVDVGTGYLLSGALVLFIVWLVAPRLIGGGDWKLLTVLGLAVGFVAPLAATAVLVVAFAVGLVLAAVHRRRHVILGPPLVVGYAVAVVAALARPELLDSGLIAGPGVG